MLHIPSKVYNKNAILHLHLPHLPAAVEQRRDARFAGRPLLVGGTGGRSTVLSCSHEARQFGIHGGMPMAVALRRCPTAIVVRGDQEDYDRESRIITEIIAEQSPVFEKAATDAFYLDLTGMDKYLGCLKWSGELRQRIIRETRLPLAAGLAVNKLVSKVRAGEARPSGEGYVPAGQERAFLAPLPVRKLPSVGRETARKLSLLGVRKTGTLSQVPVALLEREFGKPGRELHRRANGIDHRRVIPYVEKQTLAAEHTFDPDTLDPDVLHRCLRDLTRRLAYDLRQAGRLTAAVTVRIRYTDSNTYTRTRRIPHTAHDQQLLPLVRTLFDELFVRRQCIRLLGVRFDRLAPGHTQLDLFNDTQQDNALLGAMDKIRRRFGSKGLEF